MKKFLALSFSLIFVLFCFTACLGEVQRIEAEFAQHEALSDVAFYNNDICIGSKKFESSAHPLGSFVRATDGVYYLASTKNGIMNYSVQIYKCDFKASTSELVFEKSKLTNEPALTFYKDGKIHYQYNFTITGDKKGNVCEYYDIKTGQNGTCSALESTTKEYNIQVNSNAFKATHSHNGASYLIDNEFLSKTEYSNLPLEEYFTPNKVVYSNGHYLLCYTAKIKTTYLYAVFELLPNEKEIVFQSLYKSEGHLFGGPAYELFYIVNE